MNRDTYAKFDSTHWSVVLACSKQSDEAERTRVLAVLCERYWPPIYAFARRRGLDSHEAEDLTQAFFFQLIQSDKVHHADRVRGRFRTFLLTSFRNFMLNEKAKAQTHKRGGGCEILSLDTSQGESICASLVADTSSPGICFDRQWALSLLHGSMARLRTEFEQAGKLEIFEQLRTYVMGDETNSSYAEVARRLGKSEGAVKVAVHRLRRRFNTIITEDVSHTVSSPDEIGDEIRYLFAVLGGEPSQTVPAKDTRSRNLGQ